MKKQQYFNILTTKGADEATILLYGYIGEWIGWDDEKGGWTQKGVTDIDFVKELEALAAKYPRIHVRINSPGGEIFHGSAIFTAIRNCSAEVHTWIDGVAASMAGVIWMAGAKRHMAKNGMLMIHSGSGICWGNAADMREMASTLDAFDQSLVTAAADALGTTEDDMRKKYFDGKDHWLTWNDVSAEGWLSAAAAEEKEEEEEYQASAKLPDNIARMNYRDLVAWFEKQKPESKNNTPQEPGFLQKVRAFFEETAAMFGGDHTHTSHSPAEPSAKNTLEMNFTEFQKSIGDKTLDIEAVKAYLAEQTPPETPVAAQPAPNPELETLRAEVAKLTALVAEYGKQPGAGKSAPGMPADDLPANDGADTLEARLKKANELYAKAAEDNQPVQFTIAQ